MDPWYPLMNIKLLKNRATESGHNMNKTPPEYRRDILGNLEEPNKNPQNPLIPAATVVLLRTQDGQPEVLMLQKTKGIAFGGMWVFPGGRIDNDDYTDSQELFDAAKNAAVRETEEETQLTLNDKDFIWFSHWTPPPSTPKRFSTWFFAASIELDSEIEVDGGEILNHRWVTPKDALALQAKGEIELAPPTWITLYQLSLRSTVSEMMAKFKSAEPKFFSTQLMFNDDKIPVALWQGDAAYGDTDINKAGPRHRLTLSKGGFAFENSDEDY